MQESAWIETYTRAFGKLKVDRVPGRYPEFTNSRAPHKPLLLLTILDLAAQQQLPNNFIYYNTDLLDIFDLYWQKVMGDGRAGNPLLPFFHLKSDGFWHLVAQPGREDVLRATTQIRSLRVLRELVLGARLDDELYTLIQLAVPRDTLRAVLIERYFAPAMRDILVETGVITSDAFAYSRDLLERSRSRFVLAEAPTVDMQYRTEARSAGFRRVVIHAYDHTCAVCGIRLLTPEGRTSVAASHIVPWSYSHNDDPRNGLALCGLHHWAFDQGLLTVTPAHTVAISLVVPEEDRTQSLRELGGRPIAKPIDLRLWPARAALRWHNTTIYRAAGV